MISIKNWNEVFECADTRKRQRLKSFHCPSGIESRGLVNLLCHYPTQDALAAFGVFQLICQLSATLPASHRGRLIHSDETPMEVDFLARFLRVEICHLSAALEILSDQRIGWVSLVAPPQPSASHLPALCKEKEKEKEKEKIERESAGDEPIPDMGEQAQAVVSAYPRKEKVADALAIVIRHLKDGDSFEAMLAGTKACAAVIRSLPSGAANRYVPAAEAFFRAKRWADDPETLRRQGNTQSGSKPMSDEEAYALLGGRAGTTE